MTIRHFFSPLGKPFLASNSRCLNTLSVSLIALAILAPFAPAPPATAGVDGKSAMASRFDPAKHWRSADIKRGMKGYGLTVFQGTKIERFEVEILGVLQNEWTETDMILANVSGGPLAKTGVIAGMSGSPIYIEDRLIGALAYAWSFSKDSIAGITPIENMLPVLDLPATERGEAGSGAGTAPSAAGTSTPLNWSERVLSFLQKDHSGVLESPLKPARNGSGFTTLPASPFDGLPAPSSAGGEGGWVPLATPISVSGISSQALSQTSGFLAPMGLFPMPGGIPSAYTDEKVELEPGSAVGVALVRGDLEMAGIGTVTYRDENNILAFGHPMFGDGATDLPLTNAYINLVVPSLQISTKMGGAIDVVGALEQDRLPAIGGNIGASPNMLPLQIRVENKSAGLDRTFDYELAYHRFYTPRFAMACVFDAMDVAARGFRDSTAIYELTVELKDRDPIVLTDQVSSPGGIAFGLAFTLVDTLDLAMRNPYEKLEVESVELDVSVVDKVRRGTIEWIRLENTTVEWGEPLRINVAVQNWLGELEVLSHEIAIPEGVRPGPVQVTVADAMSYLMASLKQNPDRFRARDVDGLLDLMKEFYRNDEVFVTLSSVSPGVSYFGNEMSDLPTSVLRVMTDSSDRGTGTLLRQKTVLTEKIRVDRPLTGVQRILATLEEPRSGLVN